jgi:hypothetical protein
MEGSVVGTAVGIYTRVSCCVIKLRNSQISLILLTSVGLSVGPLLGFTVGAVVVGFNVGSYPKQLISQIYLQQGDYGQIEP